MVMIRYERYGKAKSIMIIYLNEFDWERSGALWVAVVWFPVFPRAISLFVAQVSEVPVFHETMSLST